jgi:large subunit ribosomal protein L1
MTDRETYTIEEALELAKKNCKAKFDATVELHVNLGVDVKKDNIRTFTTLPHGTGKDKKVAVLASKKIAGADLELSEGDLEKIEKGKLKPHVDFDVIICEPKFMPKLAKVARVLGPQGMMPNPKAGTVTEDVEKALQQVKKGKIELKNEQNAPIIHTIIGKKSFETGKLKDNFNEVIKALNAAKPAKVKPENYIVSSFVSCTMGPGYQIS